MPKTIKQCLNFIGLESEDHRIVNKVSTDSRECNENDIYIGNRYINDALSRKSVVVDNKYARKLINYFYDSPSKNYYVIGVTGTNGKTSITHYLKQMLINLGYKCIRLGTHFNEINNRRIESKNTTMDLMSNLKIFLEYKDKIDIIIMEVSSISIEEHRIDFIEFDMIIYSNISLDHLDYHKTFTQYMYSKFKLRNYLKENGRILINIDNSYLHRLFELQRKNIDMYSIKDIDVIDNQLNNYRFKYNNIEYQIKLNGPYVFINLCACLKCIEIMKLSLNIDLSELKNVDGRMEMFEHKDRIIVIDYAHTPLSLKQTLMYLNMFKKNDLICVFGCGGNRDRIKRPLMAYVASEYSDYVIVTQDNNRYEKFMDIIEDMDLKRFKNVNVVEKRENAILMALTQSKKHDIICIAGKGNEKYIFENGEQIPYNDKSFVLSN